MVSKSWEKRENMGRCEQQSASGKWRVTREKKWENMGKYGKV